MEQQLEPIDHTTSPEDLATLAKLRARDSRRAKISFTLEELEAMWDALGVYRCSGPHVMTLLNGAMVKMKQAIDILDKS